MIIIFLNVLFLFILIIIIEKSLVDFIRDVYLLLYINMFLILCYCFLCNKYLMWMIKLYYDV